MIKKVLFLILFLLASCGYQPLYSKKQLTKFTTKELQLIGDLDINKKIVSALSIKIDKEKFQNNKILLNNKKRILETSKDKQGKPDSYKMIIDLKFLLIDKENNLIEKNISEEFSYKTKENKFDLSEYEINLEENLINNIIEKLSIYISI